MGKRGPAPKPTKLKLLEGNPSGRPINRKEPQPELLAGNPEPPDFLLDVAADEWRRVAPELCRLGLLSVLDLTSLAAYCQSYARWLEAEEWLTENGSTTETASGYIQQAPQVTIANKALEKLKAFASQFGMTPSSRSTVTSNKPLSETKKGFQFDAS